MAKTYKVVVVTEMVVEVESAEVAEKVALDAARAHGAVGAPFTIKDHHAEVTVVAEMKGG